MLSGRCWDDHWRDHGGSAVSCSSPHCFKTSISRLSSSDPLTPGCPPGDPSSLFVLLLPRYLNPLPTLPSQLHIFYSLLLLYVCFQCHHLLLPIFLEAFHSLLHSFSWLLYWFCSLIGKTSQVEASSQGQRQERQPAHDRVNQCRGSQSGCLALLKHT